MSRIKGLTGCFLGNIGFYPESRIYFPLNHKLSSLTIHRKSTNCNPVNPLIGGNPDMACATLRYQTTTTNNLQIVKM
ncbi:MAG: hypothetical protein ACK5CG_17170 [Aphanizomenon sp.]|jgi:hypothetical protein